MWTSFCFLPLILIGQSIHGLNSSSAGTNYPLQSPESRVNALCPADKCPSGSCQTTPKCADNVELLSDPCHCCPYCAKQEGESCNAVRQCREGLLCSNSTCRSGHVSKCTVGAKVFEHGEIWQPNCQTVCECENGVYGCSDVCQPDDAEDKCRFGRQLVMESPCCSRLVCKTESVNCTNVTLDWTDCTCKTPISHQWSKQSPSCQWTVQQRPCRLKKCRHSLDAKNSGNKLHQEAAVIARSKAFCENSLYHRYEFITVDNCRSIRMYHQKTCASECHMPDGRRLCCMPNEFESLPVLLRCGTGKMVIRTLTVISGCNCILC